jgi:hypothetical protein
MKILQAVLSAVVFMGLAVPVARSVESDQPNVVVDFAKSAGKIRALHGVNNGPVSWGGAADLTNYHKEAGFPSARLHDCHYAGANVVDIHFIFPIFDADADDPKYYRFAETDAYLAGIVNVGEQITYRLGESIECRSRAYSDGGFYVHPPKDFAKWTNICIHIIRHYNEGWANGQHYNIKHWEIWNEPEENNIGMWVGTQQQYFELYEAAAKGIKAHDPSLKVGGSVVWMGSPLFRPFLAYCRDRKLPLDFVSWHSYPNKPEGMAGDAVTARKVFDEYGFKNTESRLTEWHPMWYKFSGGDVDCNELGNPTPQKYVAMRQKFDRMRGPEGASFVATALMLLQNTPIDMANFYTADINPWGMFDSFGVPGRVYYAFVAFNQLTKTPNRVVCEPQGAPQPDITMCAGMSDDRKTASILISNYGPTESRLAVSLQNLPLSGLVQAETLAVDATHEFARIGASVLEPGKPRLSLSIPGYAVYLVRLRLTAK